MTLESNVDTYDPTNDKPITELWVCLSEDENGNNGIAATFIANVGGLPMVTASEKVLAIFRKQVPHLEKLTGKRLKFYRFTRAEELPGDNYVKTQ